MKKLFALLIVLCMILFCGTAMGQNTEKNTNDKKGGFSVGGYDQSRKSKAPTRSVVVNEAEKTEKSVESEKSNEDGVKAVAPAPAPAMEAKEAPAAAKPKEIEKGKKGNAYGHNKGKTGGKDLGKTRSDDAKSKQKPKDDSKPVDKQK
ncbi:MAG: hypothetical protein ABSA76_12735 [Bacteroidales bacterium]